MTVETLFISNLITYSIKHGISNGRKYCLHKLDS